MNTSCENQANSCQISWSKRKIFLVTSLLFFVTFLSLIMTVYCQLAPGFFLLLQMSGKYTPTKNVPVKIEEKIITFQENSIPIRIFQPEEYHKIVIMIPGIHYDGYNEPRLKYFANVLSQYKILVITPDIYDIRNYNLVPKAVDDLVQVMQWVLKESNLKKEYTQVGFMGFSFAGGLSLIAAADDSLQGKVDFVVSFGGHADFDSTVYALITGKFSSKDTEYKKPDPYALAVLLWQYVEYYTSSPEEYNLMKKCLMLCFQYREDEYKQIREQLTPTIQKLCDLYFATNSQELGIFLKDLGIIKQGKQQFASDKIKSIDKRISPIFSPPPKSCIFIIHGIHDDVITSEESLKLAQWCSPDFDNFLLTPLISHVSLTTKISYRDIYSLAFFFSQFLRFGVIPPSY